MPGEEQFPALGPESVSVGLNLGGLFKKSCWFHLAGHKALPDKIIQFELVLGKMGLYLFRLTGDGCRPYGLVSGLHTATGLEEMRLWGQEFLSEFIFYKLSHLA